MTRGIARSALAGLMALALAGGGVPAIARADEPTSALETQLADARATYNELALEVAHAGELLNDTYYNLEETRAGIADVTAQLSEAQEHIRLARDVLARRVSANYKMGRTTLLDMILGSSSLEEFLEAVYYADKEAEQDAACIHEVQEAQSELDERKTALEGLERDQSALLAQEQQQVAALEERMAEQEDYVGSLDEQLKKKIEEQEAAELAAAQEAAAKALAEQQAREAAEAERAAKEQEAQQRSPEPEAQEQHDAPAAREAEAHEGAAVLSEAPVEQGEPASAPEPRADDQPAEPAPAPEPQTTDAPQEVAEEPEPQPSGAVASDARSRLIAAAYSQLGVTYVFGASSPGSAFDCSGFTSWCYAQIGYSLPHSSAGQSSMVANKSLSQLEPGDLMFWIGTVPGSGSGSHVALYLGNNQIIHANGRCVAIDDLTYWGNWTSCGSVL